MGMVVFFCLLLGLTGIAYYFGLIGPGLTVVDKLKKVPLRKISSCSSNQHVKVIGTATYAGRILTAPLSGRKCVYYSITVEQDGTDGWFWLIRDYHRARLIIEQENEYAFIDTSRVESYLSFDREYTSGLGNDATESLENYLKAHNHSSTTFLGFNKKLRYREAIIENGDTVIAMGRSRWRNRNELRCEIPCDKILMIHRAGDDEVVYFSNDPAIINS